MKIFKGIRVLAACVAMIAVFTSQLLADELVVTETGDVGIGVNTPDSRLQIVSIGNQVPLRVGKNDGTGDEFTMDISASQGLVNLVAGARIKADGTGYQYLGTKGASRILMHVGELRFLTSNSTTGTPGADVPGLTSPEAKMTIKANGCVGIGTINPSQKLDIQQDTDGMFGIRLKRANVSSDHNSWVIWNMDGTYGNDFEIWQYPLDGVPSNSIQRLEIQDDGNTILVPKGGNVGIGYTAPSYKLDVNGVIRGTNVSASDARWKENVETITNPLDRVTQLRGVSYDWIDKSRGEGRQLGVVAQEVEKIFPEVVHTDSQGYKSVEYSKLVAPLIEAVKALRAENERLASENQDLKSSMEDILARVETLEKSVK